MRKILVLVLLCSQTLTVHLIAQQRLPIIDVHMHSAAANSQGPPPLAICTPFYPYPSWDPGLGSYAEVFMNAMKNPPCENPVWSPMTDEEIMTQTLEVMNKFNMYGVLSGTLNQVRTWRNAAPERFIPALHFSVGQGAITPDDLRKLHADGEVAVLGEVVTQYHGILPDDERMLPYWALAEEIDMPVGIHIGTGPPGVIFLGYNNMRARMFSPFTLEEVLNRHPGLRVYIMHAAYPMLDELLAMLYNYPQLYVDLGVIIYTVNREALYRFIKGIVDAGFGNRIMFGTDQMIWPGVIERSIVVIEEAPFLTEQQKRDIFYNNAARFLRLSDDEIARHHRGGF